MNLSIDIDTFGYIAIGGSISNLRNTDIRVIDILEYSGSDNDPWTSTEIQTAIDQKKIEFFSIRLLELLFILRNIGYTIEDIGYSTYIIRVGTKFCRVTVMIVEDFSDYSKATEKEVSPDEIRVKS